MVELLCLFLGLVVLGLGLFGSGLLAYFIHHEDIKRGRSVINPAKYYFVGLLGLLPEVFYLLIIIGNWGKLFNA